VKTITSQLAKNFITVQRLGRAVYFVVVCLSVCLSVTSRQCIKRLVFGMEASFHPYPTLCCKEIWVSPKIRVLPSGNLSHTPVLENFTTVSRSRCCQQHSSPSSTVEFVDDTYTTVDESWLFTTSRSTVTLQLHCYGLLWIRCTKCYVLQSTRF